MLLDATWNFYRDAGIARRCVRHGQEIDARPTRQVRRGDDDCAGPVLTAFVLARHKFSTPQERIPQNEAGLRFR